MAHEGDRQIEGSDTYGGEASLMSKAMALVPELSCGDEGYLVSIF